MDTGGCRSVESRTLRTGASARDRRGAACVAERAADRCVALTSYRWRRLYPVARDGADAVRSKAGVDAAGRSRSVQSEQLAAVRHAAALSADAGDRPAIRGAGGHDGYRGMAQGSAPDDLGPAEAQGRARLL